MKWIKCILKDRTIVYVKLDDVCQIIQYPYQETFSIRYTVKRPLLNDIISMKRIELFEMLEEIRVAFIKD